MNIEHTLTGVTIVSDIIDGQRIKHRYLGYTDAQAKKEFKKFVRHLEKQKIKP